MDKIRWGILGTGRIAGDFATGLAAEEDAEIVAVGSRTQETADRFADRFEIPNRHPTYDALAADPKVDIIYIATPHPLHKENTISCLRAGKAVLCEKPFAINSSEAQEMIDCARANGVFLMEAMWTRFLPPRSRDDSPHRGRTNRRHPSVAGRFLLSRPVESRAPRLQPGAGWRGAVGYWCIPDFTGPSPAGGTCSCRVAGAPGRDRR